MRVLVVDDSRAMRLILSRALRQSSLRVDEIRECTGGFDALALIAAYDPQLVLCDWELADMTAGELMRNAHASGNERTFGFVAAEQRTAELHPSDDGNTSLLLTRPFNGARIDDALGHLAG
jgi:two-component system chemotaxis response regulator CheY